MSSSQKLPCDLALQVLPVRRAVAAHFTALALSKEVTLRPQRWMLSGVPVVMYRGSDGQVIAHMDRCPHRNAPLSAGRICKDGSLECPYHGWRFKEDGACSLIPGSVNVPKESHRLETLSAEERSGIVFVRSRSKESSDVRASDEPLIPTEAASASYTTLTRKVTFPAGLHAVVENALDVPHTSVLHRGLFRGGERNRVRVHLRRYETLAEAEYIGEPPPSGFLARALRMGTVDSLTVEHFDRFLLPGILQVEYRLGSRAHILITGYLTEQGECETNLFALVCLRTPLYRFVERVLLRLIEPLAMRVVRQDIEILKAQTENVRAFGGGAFMSTEIDILGAAVTRLLKQQAAADAEGRLLPHQLKAPPEEVPREERTLELDA